MKHWLMKTEPDVFSFEDLVRSPGKTTFWEGVRNYQARNLMRDEIKLGDLVLIYHSNLEEPVIAGIAEVVKEGRPDNSALDPKSAYFDEKAAAKNTSPWIGVEVKAIVQFTKPVGRTALKNTPELAQMMVLRKGARLSVQPVSKSEYDQISKMGAPQRV
jgi:predicted RNA-binding protein with PUA-like domain